MNLEALPYPYGRHLTVAGCLTLVTLTTAVIYACHSTPYTMVLFLGGGSTLLLAAVVLFAWTIWKDLAVRLDSIGTRQFAAGQIIFRQGDPAEHVYVVTKGLVEAVYAHPAKGDIVLGRFGQDDFFGESAILSQVPRQVTARAVEAAEVLVIHYTDFLPLYTSLPRFRARIEAQQDRRKALVNQVRSTH